MDSTKPLQEDLRNLRIRFIVALITSISLPVELYLYILDFLLPGHFYNKKDLQILFERYPVISNIDLSGALLEGANLSECTFRNVKFNRAIMNRVNFRESIFIWCDFFWTDLEDCNWTRVKATGSFGMAMISGGIFVNSDFRNTDLLTLYGPEKLIESEFPNWKPTIFMWNYEKKCWVLN